MSERSHSSSFRLYVRVAGVLVLIALAIVAGLWFGAKSVHFEDQPRPVRPADAPSPAGAEPTPPPEPAPLFFSLRVPSGAAQATVVDEIAMASAAGIHQYVVDVPLPWAGDMNSFLAPIALIAQNDPAAKVMLSLNLDPPAAWLTAHPEEVAQTSAKDPPSISLVSETWRRETRSAIEALISGIKTSQQPDTVLGYVLGGLEDGQWRRANGYDKSAPNTARFRQWLTARYKDDAMLRQAWADPAVALNTAPIPDKPDTSNTCKIFFNLPDMQRQVDYLQYTSETTADTIALFAACVKQAAGKTTCVVAPYGYSYELTNNDAGHFALSRLLDGDLDGFVSPVSYVDRGLGGAGGMMGPVDTAREHHKLWFLIDDTRTGIARDPATGEIGRPKNIRPEDAYYVQQRNFAAAVCHGLGLMWSDAEGDGELHDADMWQRFGKMRTIYQQTIARKRHDAQSTPPFPAKATIAVVVDETSRFYQQCDKRIDEILLNQVRDCASRAGAPTKFYLLCDVLEQKAAPAPVYLFLNAFRLTADDRSRLQDTLRQNKATAIWMFAPGYIDQSPSPDNITATVNMNVKRFEHPAQAGSVFLLPGRWIGKDAEFGPAQELQPLFYIDDPETNVIANYRASGKASLGITFFPEGGASVFCAEPSLTPAVLREILAILEHRLYYQVAPAKFYDAVQSGPNLLAIHAKESGDRVIDLDQVCDVQDLFAPEIGWPRKRTLCIPLKTGETRLLKLTPVEPEQTP